MYTDIQNALDNRRVAEENKEYQLLLEETFVDPGVSMDDIIAESFRQEVGALYRLVMKLYDRGVADINGVTSEELTQLSNYISAAEKTLRDYPFVEQLKPRAMEYYTSAVDWVNKNIGELDDSGQPIQLINESQVREYTEAWKYMTTTWKATIDGSRGIEDSVATDNASMKLLSVTANPDFITDAVFELAILPIKINGVNTNRLHLIVHYKGHTYQPVSIHTAEGSDIFKRVLFMQRDNRNKHIIVNNFDVHRTNGRMIPGARKSIKERGIVNDPWDTEYTSNQRQFGITRIRKNPKTGLNDVVLIVPGVKGGIKKELYNFGPSKDLTAGMMFMVINPV